MFTSCLSNPADLKELIPESFIHTYLYKYITIHTYIHIYVHSYISLGGMYTSCLSNPADLKELIPEFFCGGGEFLSNGTGLDLGRRYVLFTIKL
jgi:hypothetical protein